MLVSYHMKICILLQNFDSYERIIALFNLDYFIKQFIHPTPPSLYIGILQDFACLLLTIYEDLQFEKTIFEGFFARFKTNLVCTYPTS